MAPEIDKWSHESRGIEKVADEVDALLENLIEVHFYHEAPRPEQFIHPDGYQEAYDAWYDGIFKQLRGFVIINLGGKPSE